MARPQTNLSVLEARGSIKKNPQRYRERLERAKNAPEPPPLGDPPERWNVASEAYYAVKFARFRAIWYEFAPMIRTGSPMKRALLELFCEQMDRFRTSASSMKASEKAHLLQLICKLDIDEKGGIGGKKQEPGSNWSAFA